MKNFIEKKKKFPILLLILVLTAILYKGYKIIDARANYTNKEVVTLLLKNNEIKNGIDEVVKKYNKNNDEIYINLILTNDDYTNLLYTKLANNDQIDIFEYSGKTLLEKDFIQPLKNLDIDLSNVKDNATFLYNDEIIGVKYGSAMPKIMYNNELLVKAGIDPEFNPKTLDELIYILEKIKSSCPDIVPLDLSLNYIHDIFSILGTASTSENSTYPTFWNYKTGEYDYSGLSLVIEKFKEMYDKNLITLNFDTRTTEDMFNDFKNEKSAMMITNYYQKYSVIDRLEGIDVRFSNIPFASENNGRLYYYTYPRTLVIANNQSEDMSDIDAKVKEKHNAAVKKVYEWLLSEDVTNYLVENDNNFASFGNNYFHNDMYDGLNDNKGYEHSLKDPTEVLVGNSDIVKKNIFAMIKGEVDIKNGIVNLKTEMNNFINNNERNKDVELGKYKE
ncbi:ABC transporter substrate-binding protein [Clostridium tertium]|uniref:ABC transporter substrate-binding protein n=1 Tax=Clostridium tertium TaxID=1559 RepID=UPI0024B3A8C2|nr:ABC transporter substrate-binding protein [Clostridium tertium]MDI9216980.1 ABC transporter substrate-binding protein [Clostridium tertium]